MTEPNDNTGQVAAGGQEGGQPIASIIIPTHNSEEFLPECLDSALRQTLRDIEIIVVDDCSTDGTLEMLESHARGDGRVRVLKLEENKGPGIARNIGIDAARGTYLYFLDSDDYCDCKLLEKAVAHIEETQADICAFPIKRLDMRVGKPVRAWWCLPPDAMFEGTRTWRDYNGNAFDVYQNFAWNKVFRRSFIEEFGIRFQDIFLTEDLMFTAVALIRARGISVIDEPLIVHREGTSKNTMSNKDAHPVDFIAAFSAFKEFLENEGYMADIKDSYLEWTIGSCAYNLNTLSSYESYCTAFAALVDGDAEKLGLLDSDCPVFSYERNTWLLEALKQNDPGSYLFRVYRDTDDNEQKLTLEIGAITESLTVARDEARAERDALQREYDRAQTALEALRVEYDAKMNAAEQKIGQAVCKVPRMAQQTLIEKRNGRR